MGPVSNPGSSTALLGLPPPEDVKFFSNDLQIGGPFTVTTVFIRTVPFSKRVVMFLMFIVQFELSNDGGVVPDGASVGDEVVVVVVVVF